MASLLMSTTSSCTEVSGLQLPGAGPGGWGPAALGFPVRDGVGCPRLWDPGVGTGAVHGLCGKGQIPHLGALPPAWQLDPY